MRTLVDAGPRFRGKLSAPSEGGCVVAVAGELDLCAAPQSEELLRQGLDVGARRIVVDLTEATFIDAAALGVLVGGARRLRAADGALVLVCPSEKIRRILE